MKRKIFSVVLALAMLLTLAPVALAQEAEAPYVTGFEIVVKDATGNDHSMTVSNSSLIAHVAGTTIIDTLSFTVTFNEAIDFVVSPGLTMEGENVYVPSTDVPRGALYVSSYNSESGVVTLNLNVVTGTLNFNSTAYSLTMTTEDHITWNTPEPYELFYGFTMFDLANNLNNPVPIPAGSAKSTATGTESLINNIIINSDSENVYMREGGAGVAIDTVTYICNAETYVWKAPHDSVLVYPVIPQFETLEYKGWFLDSGYTEPVPADYKVENNLTLYAKYESTDMDNFAKDLANQDIPTVTILTKDDFKVFANQASIVKAGRRVILGADLDYTTDAAGDKTFEAIQFNANFDGNGHTITGLTFTPNGENAGMFAKIGQGQIIANLNLDSITVEYAQNAGVLAGSISANSGDTPTASRPLIQNVQVTKSTVDGQNAGGIVGYTFITIIKYCSVSDTTITGLVNAGGIAAQSYTNINNCYTKNVTLDSLLPYDGGIVATMLEASSVTNCWTTYENIVYRHNDGTVTHCVENAEDIPAEEVQDYGFDPTYWNIGEYVSEFTFTTEIYYDFE